MNEGNTQIRATFKDTKNNQELLREKLDELEQENRCIKDEQERIELFNLIANSTLGLGIKSFRIPMDNFHIVDIENVEQFIRVLLYYEKNLVGNDFFFDVTLKENEYSCNISHLWKYIKFALFGIFPEALSASIRISKEIVDIRKKVKSVQTVKQ